MKHKPLQQLTWEELKYGRFYLTNGASLRLQERRYLDVVEEEPLTQVSIERAVINLSIEKRKDLLSLNEDDYKSDKTCSYILKKSKQKPSDINKNIRIEIINRLNRGLGIVENQTILHTAPHHDDIMLGYLPYINHLARTPLNQHFFATLTSGFTAVTNSFMLELMENLKNHLVLGTIKTKRQFDPEFIEGRNQDVNIYLDGIAAG